MGAFDLFVMGAVISGVLYALVFHSKAEEFSKDEGLTKAQAFEYAKQEGLFIFKLTFGYFVFLAIGSLIFN